MASRLCFFGDDTVGKAASYLGASALSIRSDLELCVVQRACVACVSGNWRAGDEGDVR